MIGDLLQWHLVYRNSVNKLHQHIFIPTIHPQNALLQPHTTTTTNPEVLPQTKNSYQSPNTLIFLILPLIPPKLTDITREQMCRETRWTYRACHHSGGRRFEYCGFATSTDDLKIEGLSGPPRHIMCTLPETIDHEVPGYCPTCRDSAYKAKEDGIAARGRRRY